MKTFKQIFILCFTLLFFSNLEAQIDCNWYVKNQNCASSYNEGSNAFRYDTPIALNFSIDSVSHPLPQIVGREYRNNIFIIFNNGHYYNNRYDTNKLLGTPGKYGYNITTTLLPRYLYFSNLYETDDPPKKIKVNPSTNPIITTSVNITLPDLNKKQSTNSILSTNQDLMPGKDVTLIIDLKTCSSIGNAVLTYNSQVLTPQKIFGNPGSETWSYNNTSAITSLGTISIPPSGEFEYIDFRVNETIQPTVTFNISGCQAPFVGSLTENVSSMYHDPNFVQVKCVHKDANGQNWVKYKVQAYNDGVVASKVHVTFNLNLPNAVDPNSIVVCDWNHGGKPGCGLRSDIIKSYNLNTTSFAFQSHLPDVTGTGGSKVPSDKQMAWLEFCVKIKSGNPATVDLQPSIPISQFDTTPYSITNFIDPCIYNQEVCLRTVSKDCGCLCKKKVDKFDTIIKN
jgi:hypothetical protein